MKKGRGDSGKAYHVGRELSMKKKRRKEFKKIKDPLLREFYLALED
jgi:hypothetical protein